MNQVVRYGMTVGDRGQQGSLGFWPSELDDPRYGPGSFIARAKQVRSQVLKIAQRHHAMFEEQRRASAKGESPRIPDPPARQAQSQKDLDALKALRAEYEKIDGEVFDFGLNTRGNLFDYKSDINDALLRQELRGHLRSLDEKNRAAALKGNVQFRRAVLETLPALSGLSQTQYERLVDQEMSSKFPDRVRTIAHFDLAREAVEAALKAVDEAAKNESVASGAASLIEREAKKPAAQPEWI